MQYLQKYIQPWQIHIIAGILLLLIPIQALTAAWHLTPTVDEGSKLGSGYAYLVTGKFRTNWEHPPLGKVLIALPFFLVKENTPPDINEWDAWYLWPDQYVTPGVEDIDYLFWWARFSTAILTLLLGVVIYLWGNQLFGVEAGLLSLLMFSFNTAILAMAGIVNTDTVAALFVTLFLYSLWRLVHFPTRLNLIGAGLAFGLAQLSKLSALFLGPVTIVIVVLVWLYPLLSRRSGQDTSNFCYPTRDFKWYFGSLTIIFVIGAFAIWAGYGFEVAPAKEMKPGSTASLTFWPPNYLPQPVGHLFEEMLVPAPMYFKGIGGLAGHAKAGHSTYLAGMYSTNGWWYYFPLAFLLKTPLPTIVLIFLGLTLSFAHYREWYCKDVFLLLPLAVYGFSAIMSSLNIGYRHILPLLPLLFVLAGRVAIWSGVTWRRLGFVFFLCGWLIFESVTIWPHYLAYFNQLAGGPENGHNWLVNSNLDWGQDLYNLKVYMDEHDIETVKLSYLGSVPPEFYGIQYECLPVRSGILLRDGCPQEGPVNREPGIYVISATNLVGSGLPDPDTFVWFRNQEPIARIGYSLFVYEVKE